MSCSKPSVNGHSTCVHDNGRAKNDCQECPNCYIIQLQMVKKVHDYLHQDREGFLAKTLISPLPTDTLTNSMLTLITRPHQCKACIKNHFTNPALMPIYCHMKINMDHSDARNYCLGCQEVRTQCKRPECFSSPLNGGIYCPCCLKSKVCTIRGVTCRFILLQRGLKRMTREIEYPVNQPLSAFIYHESFYKYAKETLSLKELMQEVGATYDVTQPFPLIRQGGAVVAASSRGFFQYWRENQVAPVFGDEPLLWEFPPRPFGPISDNHVQPVQLTPAIVEWMAPLMRRSHQKKIDMGKRKRDAEELQLVKKPRFVDVLAQPVVMIPPVQPEEPLQPMEPEETIEEILKPTPVSAFVKPAPVAMCRNLIPHNDRMKQVMAEHHPDETLTALLAVPIGFVSKGNSTGKEVRYVFGETVRAHSIITVPMPGASVPLKMEKSAEVVCKLPLEVMKDKEAAEALMSLSRLDAV